MHRYFLLILLFFLTACSPASSVDVESTPQLIRIYATSTTEEWIPLVYDCADRTQIGLVSRTPNITAADISLRFGATENGYLIDETELVVVSNAKNPVITLSRAQVAAIFEGKIRNWAKLGGEDSEIQLWVYGQDDDLQVTFSEAMLEGGKISSLARQAQNQKEMRREIAGDANALGIISQAQADENLHTIHSLGKLPVLAVLKVKSPEILFPFLTCLQEK